MKLRNFIIIFLIPFPVVSYSQKTNSDSAKVEIKDVTITDTVEEEQVPPPPPPRYINSKFKTLQNWLLNICNANKPKKPIQEYTFGLFESPNNNTFFLVGVNTYEEGNRSTIRIEFEPSTMYFTLPKKEYGKLSHEQLLDKLMSELKNFTKTKTFKTSFLSKANTIILESNGQIIWSK